MTGAIAVQLAIYGVTNGAVVALNAVGFTLAYAVARQINLAHGNVFALTTVVVASTAGALGISASAPMHGRAGALVLLVAVGAVCGALLNVGIERLAFAPFLKVRDPLGPLIATVGLSFVLLQVAILWRATFIAVPSGWPRPHHGVNEVPLLSMPDLLPRVDFGLAGVSFTLKDALVLVLGGLVAIGINRLLARTRAGLLLRAVAQDPDLAALSGGDPASAQVLAFALAGGLAGLGAAIFAAYYGGVSPQYGLLSGLTAMSAAVLGGVGDPRGALVGGLALGLFTAFSDFLLDAQWTPVLTMSLLVILLSFRPAGLLGRRPERSSENVPSPSRPTATPSQSASRWVLGGLLLLGLMYPWVDQTAGLARLFTISAALLLVTLAVGLTIVVGFAGMLDLGYAAFFAIGGYTAALITASGSQLAAWLPPLLREPWLALVIAGLVAAGFGLAFGLPTIRARGEYLAIVTLAFGQIVPGVLLHVGWTGGPLGLSGIPPVAFAGWDLGLPVRGYVLALLLAVVASACAFRLAPSRIGRAWAAVRDDDLAAAASGVDATRARLLAFVIGAAYAGVAGAIYAGLVGSIEPDQFGSDLSLMVLAAVVIGAHWGVLGAIGGGLIVALYDRILVDAVNALLHIVGQVTWLNALTPVDLRGENFAVFGIALYLATLARTRARDESVSGARREGPRSATPPVPAQTNL